MKTVSSEAQEAMVNLIEWEMMGFIEIDLKKVLRSLSLSDLSVVSANIDAIPDAAERFVCVRLVRLELEYRLGRIEDWSYTRRGDVVDLSFQSTVPIKHITLNLILEEACK